MKQVQQPNLLLETLAYLGRRASGNTWQHMEQRICQRKIEPSAAFCQALNTLKEITAILDSRISLKEADLLELFDNLEGFPHNTIGSSSAAFLLFYPVLEEYDGSLNRLLSRIRNLSPGQVAYNIAATLDLTDDCSSTRFLDGQELIDLVLPLSVPDKTKISLLDIYRNYNQLLERAAGPVSSVLNILESEKESLQKLADSFFAEISAIGPDAYFEDSSHLELRKDSQYYIRPFLFGMDTNLTSDIDSNTVCVYCGILRRELLHMLNGQSSASDDVYEAFRLLGDRTRFDILCYLHDHSAYGQELSDRFNLSRNTIHHHMNKLMSSSLVTCTIDGNRVYYSLDKEAFNTLLVRQRELFCGPDL